MTNEYAAEFELIATVPSKDEVHKIQQRITRIEGEMKANNENLQKLPIAKLKELGEKHKTERDQANERLKKALALFALKAPHAKKLEKEKGK